MVLFNATKPMDGKRKVDWREINWLIWSIKSPRLLLHCQWTAWNVWYFRIIYKLTSKWSISNHHCIANITYLNHTEWLRLPSNRRWNSVQPNWRRRWSNLPSRLQTIVSGSSKWVVAFIIRPLNNRPKWREVCENFFPFGEWTLWSWLQSFQPHQPSPE